MKITFISPYSTITNIGIRIISAVLKKEGHKVKLIFIPGNPYTKKNKRYLFTAKINIEEYYAKNLDLIVDLAKGSDLIGISLVTNILKDAIKITQKLKNNLKVPIIWGGPHPTAEPEKCLEYADFICQGEGEETIVELAKNIELKENYKNIQNLSFKNENGEIIKNPLRPLIQDLDVIPFQDYDLEDQYIIIDGKSYEKTEIDLKAFFDTLFLGNEYQTYVTRGCPRGCSYCFNSNFNKLYPNQNIFRRRSVDNIINELIQIKKSLPFISAITIIDDNFLELNDDYIEEFSRKYKKYINLSFALNGVHPSTVSRKKLEYLTNAGLSGIRMGIQSASERTKKLYKRYYSNSQAKEACKIINEFKDKIKIVHYDVILENPWETEQDLIKTLIFLNKLPLPHILVLFSLTFFPGTELYDLAKKEGIIKEEVEEIYEKCYWEISPTYVNKLFFLLSDYAIVNKKIHPIIMSILVNRFFRKIGLSSLLYYFIRMGAQEIIELR